MGERQRDICCDRLHHKVSFEDVQSKRQVALYRSRLIECIAAVAPDDSVHAKWLEERAMAGVGKPGKRQDVYAFGVCVASLHAHRWLASKDTLPKVPDDLPTALHDFVQQCMNDEVNRAPTAEQILSHSLLSGMFLLASALSNSSAFH